MKLYRILPSSITSSVCCVLAVTLISFCQARLANKQVLIISLDGFGQSMLQRFNIPNIKNFFHSGSHPRVFTNQFPTKTYPNHFSLATGQYVETHGVVGTEIFDSTLNIGFNSSQPEFFQQNSNTKPLWILNEEQGGVSACLQWVGCGFNYHGTKETYSLPFDTNYSFEVLIDVALKLLLPSSVPNTSHSGPNVRVEPTTTPHPTPVMYTASSKYNADTLLQLVMQYSNNRTANIEVPANLVMMYFNEPDYTGHLHGTHSDTFTSTIEKLDAGIGYLMKQIELKGLKDTLDVILVSDHGMIDILPTNIINLNDIETSASYKTIDYSPVLQILPAKEDILTVYKAFLDASTKHNFSVLIKNTLPEELHFKHNSRIASILVQSNPGYVFQDFENIMREFPHDNSSTPYGNHGYYWKDCPDMLPIMIAAGPSFKQNVEVPSASNIDVYPLVCSLLSLNPPPINGSMKYLELMLQEPPMLSFVYDYILAFCAILGILGILIAVYCRYVRHGGTINRRTRQRSDPQALISGYSYSAPSTSSFMPRPSAIMSSEDELEEEEKLLNRQEEWEV